jgi:hypothetical protein
VIYGLAAIRIKEQGEALMTVTFSQGQFFHPRYGWFDKEPDLPNYKHRSGLVNEKIGAEHLITSDHPMYEEAQKARQAIIEHSPEGSRMAQSLKDYDPATAVFEGAQINDVYEQSDLSYYLDGKTKFAGTYAFIYEGNTMTVQNRDWWPPKSDPVDVVSHYEEHRANIQDLKKQGFHDDTVSMLMDVLNETFVNTRSGSFEGEQLYYRPGMSEAQTKQVTKSLFEEYLRVRDSAGSTEKGIRAAANNLKRRELMHEQHDLFAPHMYAPSTPELKRRIGENITAFSRLEPDPGLGKSSWDPADTHIRNIDALNKLDYSKNKTMSEVEKEARSLSVVFRVRGEQMIDYARRYEEISGQLDSKRSSGEISQEHYERHKADLDTAFVKTHNLNVKGQAMAAGLSEEKAAELAMAFSQEYIKARKQAEPNEINADKLANTALKSIAAQGWPEFSLSSTENRATAASNDPWYAMMSEDALYWRTKPQPYEYW